MKIAILSILTALLPSVTYAQQPHGPELQFNPRRWHTLNPICPVVFGAQANAAPLMTLAADGSSTPVRTVSLQFGMRDSRTIDSATVTIRGVTQSHLYLKTGKGPEEKQERTFHIESRAGSNGFTQSDLSVSGIMSLRTAEITEIRFTDGTSWRPTGIDGCVAYFNGVHLVNADSMK